MFFIAVFMLVAVFFLRSQAGRVATGFGDYVRERHWEVNSDYTHADLAKWVRDNPSDAVGYAAVLFPWDIAFALCLGLGLALLCSALGRYLALPDILVFALAVPPLVFLALDLTEDRMLRGFLTDPASITEAAVATSTKITGAKILAVKVALGEATLLLLGAGVLWIRALY